MQSITHYRLTTATAITMTSSSEKPKTTITTDDSKLTSNSRMTHSELTASPSPPTASALSWLQSTSSYNIIRREDHDDYYVEHEDENDISTTTRRYRISLSIRAKCIELKHSAGDTISDDDAGVCLFNQGQYSEMLDSDLIVEAMVEHESTTADGQDPNHYNPDYDIVSARYSNLRVLYHWSEANHEAMAAGNNEIVESWLNLNWSNRVMKVPVSLIRQLSQTSSSLSTLQFRVFVRLVDHDDPWMNLAMAFDIIEVTIGAAPSSGSCQFVPPHHHHDDPPATAELSPIMALETPVRVQCLDWIDPLLDTSVMQESVMTASNTSSSSYRTSLQLRRSHS